MTHSFAISKPHSLVNFRDIVEERYVHRYLSLRLRSYCSQLEYLMFLVLLRECLDVIKYVHK